MTEVAFRQDGDDEERRRLGDRLREARKYLGLKQEEVATYLKIPVSTTHTITGAIIGVGSVTRLRSIRWGLASRIIWAWIFTIPMAGLVGAACLAIARGLHAW